MVLYLTAQKEYSGGKTLEWNHSWAETDVVLFFCHASVAKLHNGQYAFLEEY